jgi:hypothetical protein
VTGSKVVSVECVTYREGSSLGLPDTRRTGGYAATVRVAVPVL